MPHRCAREQVWKTITMTANNLEDLASQRIFHEYSNHSLDSTKKRGLCGTISNFQSGILPNPHIFGYIRVTIPLQSTIAPLTSIMSTDDVLHVLLSTVNAPKDGSDDLTISEFRLS